MEPVLTFAKPTDDKDIYRVMHEVKNSMTDKELYFADDLAYIRETLTQKGFALKACDEKNRIVGFLLVHFPGDDPDNLGYYLNLPPAERLKTAHMDSVAILSDFRGLGLQRKLLLAAEAAEQLSPYRYLMATVSPKNPYSLQNFLRLGYRIVCKTIKPNGWERYVLCKNLNIIQKGPCKKYDERPFVHEQ